MVLSFGAKNHKNNNITLKVKLKNMKISKLILSLILGILILSSCNNYNNGILKGVQVTDWYIYPTIDKNFKIPKKPTKYNIDSAKIDNNIMTISLSYIGECGEHGFDLIFNGMYKKSLPRQADLYLLHEYKVDTCTKINTLELRYSLDPIIGQSKQATNFTLYSYPEKLKYIGGE